MPEWGTSWSWSAQQMQSSTVTTIYEYPGKASVMSVHNVRHPSSPCCDRWCHCHNCEFVVVVGSR